MPAQRIAISLVEKGWGGARRLSIRLSRQGVPVRHLIRGRLPSEVLAVIQPYDGVTLRGIPRAWFKVVAWVELCRAGRRGAVAMVMVDNQRTAQWMARWVPWLRDRVVVIEEQPDGSPRIVRHGAGVEPGLLPVKGQP